MHPAYLASESDQQCSLRPRVAISTLGCRLNQFESEKMVAEFVSRGFRRVDERSPADIHIINTCTVTHKADSDSGQYARRVIKANPKCAVVVAGCFVDKDSQAAMAIPGVSAVVKNSEKETIVAHLQERLAVSYPTLAGALSAPSISQDMIPEFAGHHRAWLKVSDGCNQWCSFCILPTVRGRLKNRSTTAILNDVQGLIARGYREIVLTGINVGHYSWRQSSPEIRNLAELVRLFLRETSGVRFRLSSIEPQTVRSELRELYAEGDTRLCRHWHLPLQSGSARILKLMRRPYSPEYYRRLAEELKSSRSGTIIGADVIVGFPGETEADFAATRELVASGLLDYLHVFSYSDRQGTTATAMSDKTSPDIIRARNRELTEISASLKQRALSAALGTTIEVIAEGEPNDQVRFGTSDNFLRVQFSGGASLGYEAVPMRATDVGDGYLTGEIIRPQSNFPYQAENSDRPHLSLTSFGSSSSR